MREGKSDARSFYEIGKHKWDRHFCQSHFHLSLFTSEAFH